MQIDIQDLTIRGNAYLKSKGSKVNERVTIEAPLDICKISFKFGSKQDKDANVSPTVEI